MIGFELRTTGVGGVRSINCVTTIFLYLLYLPLSFNVDKYLKLNYFKNSEIKALKGY